MAKTSKKKIALKMKSWFVLFGLGTSWTAVAATQSIEVEFKNSEGKKVGTVTLTELKQGVKINLQTQGLSAGEHAFHIHENGECRTPDFKSAGDHLHSKSSKHGFDVSGGPHAGDMPNIIVGPDGIGRVEVINTKVTLSKGPNSLLKKGGTALVIHAKADDYRSQPSGDAGDRVACAEIKP